jgi:hypothetical protein
MLPVTSPSERCLIKYQIIVSKDQLPIENNPLNHKIEMKEQNQLAFIIINHKSVISHAHNSSYSCD